MSKKLSNPILIALIALIVVLDQFSKYIIKSTMSIGEHIPVLGEFFQITYVENPGMAFGIKISNPYVFMGLSLIAAGVVFYYLYKLRSESWLLQLALIFITAGAIGNLSDRFIYGKVIDFLDFEFIDIVIPAFSFLGINFSGYELYRWPVFNVADMAVSGGMIILISYLIFVGDPLKNAPKNQTISPQASKESGEG
ncbi:MAG: signal peptidase II [Calditrichaceae bacterium]|nr:signal peptidase II [Calditrichaceae bacterium]MBN2708235.1 signal peptidase II [Calditrichaceae bacterium]RQV92258.1 MAG: signal peptidase II [Calditrichota bacterium]